MPDSRPLDHDGACARFKILFSFPHLTSSSTTLALTFVFYIVTARSGVFVLRARTQVDQSVDDLNNGAGIFASGDQRSAIVNDTILYLPYCTGDVHTGKKFRRVLGFLFSRARYSVVISTLRRLWDRIPVTQSVFHVLDCRSCFPTPCFLLIFCKTSRLLIF